MKDPNEVPLDIKTKGFSIFSFANTKKRGKHISKQEKNTCMDGTLKQPLLLPHNLEAVVLSLQYMCLTNPHGVSQTKMGGAYLSDRYKSAASRTDSCKMRNLDATVT